MVTGVASMTANVNASPVAAAIKDGGAPVKSDRRSNKPIMEKRRRARINNCLNELKTLILDATKKDPARHSKLEKADILEKTVKHLQELQRQQSVMQQAADPKVINKFKAGFTDCANEVSRFPGLEPSVKRRLLQHLTSCINGVKTELHQHQRQVAAAQAQQLHAHMLPSPPSSPPQEAQQSGATSGAAAAAGYVMSSQIQQTANGYFLPNGLQVIPTKLANGSIAMVLPHGMPAQQPQTSAVAAVAVAAAAAAQQQQQQFHLQQQQLQQQQQQMHFQSPQSMPTRTASTGSASSHSSYERTLASSPAVSVSYAPPSPANSYEAMDCKPSVIQHAPASYGQPLSLVVKKQQQQQQQPQIKEEEQPWRPW